MCRVSHLKVSPLSTCTQVAVLDGRVRSESLATLNFIHLHASGPNMYQLDPHTAYGRSGRPLFLP